MPTSHDWINATLSDGRYLIETKLGEGGMGSVYRARDRNLDTDVVIKTPLRTMVSAPEFTRRFQDEIRSLVRLSHPAVVKVSDVGEWDGLPFAVMQYLSGGSLEDRIARWGRGPHDADRLREILSWLPTISSALDFVHGHGFVHRDVKPANVLFDGMGHPFLGDFGVVKVVADTESSLSFGRAAVTGAGMLVGTPEYMAPELIRGKSVDGRVDQYALAVTVYELLAGRRPFEDEWKPNLLLLHSTQPPTPLETICPWLPTRLSEAVQTAMAKDPTARFASCAAFAGAVISALSDLPKRLKLKCGTCGKLLTLTPVVFARLQQNPRPVPCPACKSPVDVLALGGTYTAGSSGGSTSAVSIPEPTLLEFRASSGAGPATPPGAGRTLVEGAAAAVPGRGATRIEPPLARAAESGLAAPEAPTPTPTPSPKRSGTLLESTARPPRSRTMVEGGPAGGKTVFEPIAPLGGAEAPSGEPTSSLSPRLLIGGAVGGVAVVLVVGVAVFLTLRRPLTPTGPMSSDSASVVAKLGPMTTGLGARLPDAAKPSPTPTTTPPSINPTTLADRDPGSIDPVPKRRAKSRVPAKPSELARDDSTAEPTTPVASRSNTPPKLAPPRSTLDAEDARYPLDGRLRTVPLIKLQREPSLGAGEPIFLEYTYTVSRIGQRMPDGSARLEMVASLMEVNFRGASNTTAQVRRNDALRTTVELAPSLADHLEQMEKVTFLSQAPSTPAWDGAPALVTVIATNGNDRPALRMLRIEFFEEFGFRSVMGNKPTLHVHYMTRTVTGAAVGAPSRSAYTEEWGKVNRLNLAELAYQKMFNIAARAQSEAQWTRLSASMGSMLSSAVSAATAMNSSNAEFARNKAMGR